MWLILIGWIKYASTRFLRNNCHNLSICNLTNSMLTLSSTGILLFLHWYSVSAISVIDSKNSAASNTRFKWSRYTFTSSLFVANNPSLSWILSMCFYYFVRIFGVTFKKQFLVVFVIKFHLFTKFFPFCLLSTTIDWLTMFLLFFIPCISLLGFVLFTFAWSFSDRLPNFRRHL